MTDGRGPIAGTTRFAEVVVNLDVSGEIASFHYRVPSTLDLRAGHLIEVPFGARRAQGIVLDVGHTTPVTETHDVTALLDPAPALRPHQIDLARWIADYYCCRLVDAVLLMLPAGIERRTHLIYAATTAEQRRLVALEDDPNDYEVVEYLRRHGPLRYERLRSGLGLRRLDQRLRRLEHERLVTRHWELEAPRARPRLVTRIVAAVAPDALRAAAANLRAPKQRTLLEWLAGQPLGGAYTYGEIEAATGASRAAVGALATRGLLQIERLESRRDPLAGRPLSEVAPPYLTGAQAAVWERLRAGIAAQ
ncbi:MAG: hypothetical protein HY329_15630, partial [Chloroflexi bacterium]|nr:hypothetical protein [Chloroflexota bacterium]